MGITADKYRCNLKFMLYINIHAAIMAMEYEICMDNSLKGKNVNVQTDFMPNRLLPDGSSAIVAPERATETGTEQQ